MVQICEGIQMFNDMGIIELLAYPNACNHFFWGYMLAGLFIILTLILYWREVEIKTNPDILSCAGVSSIATVILALIGSLSTPAIVQQDILLYTLAFTVVIVALWIFKE